MWPFNRKKTEKKKGQVPKARNPQPPPPARIHPDDNSLLNYMIINSAIDNNCHHRHSDEQPIRHDYPDGGSFGGGGASESFDSSSSSDSSSYDSGSSYDSSSDSSSYSSND